ncbi:MAG TPA: L-aspartate oxidase, partial [Nitrospiria bacterium]
ANRLASNSLLEGLVFGARAAEYASSSPRKSISAARSKALLKKPLKRAIGGASQFPKGLARLRRLLGAAMWRHAGVIRNEAGLSKALRRIESWEGLTEAPIHSQQEGEFKNLVTAAALITRAARLRKNSLGVHFRSDDPEPAGTGLSPHIAFRFPGKTVGYFT